MSSEFDKNQAGLKIMAELPSIKLGGQDMTRQEQATHDWTERGKKALVGRKIVGFRYLDALELDGLDWHYAAPVLILDDGNVLFPSADDEGNNAGALFTTIEGLETIPVMRP